MSLNLKLGIVKLSSTNITQTELSRRVICSQSTVSKILKQKDDLIQEAAENEAADCKRNRKGKADDVELSTPDA